jgi:hypothetical protein
VPATTGDTLAAWLVARTGQAIEERDAVRWCLSGEAGAGN